MTLSLPTFLTLSEAARKYGLDETRLRQLVEAGKIRAGTVTGEVVVSEEEVKKQVTRKEDLPEYRKHAHLRGTPIWISEAARRYKIADRTIINWVERGLIKGMGFDKNKRLIDEADIAYCAEIYHQRKGQGKWVFDSSGLPYKPKTGPLA